MAGLKHMDQQCMVKKITTVCTSRTCGKVSLRLSMEEIGLQNMAHKYGGCSYMLVGVSIKCLIQHTFLQLNPCGSLSTNGMPKYNPDQPQHQICHQFSCQLEIASAVLLSKQTCKQPPSLHRLSKQQYECGRWSICCWKVAEILLPSRQKIQTTIKANKIPKGALKPALFHRNSEHKPNTQDSSQIKLVLDTTPTLREGVN